MATEQFAKSIEEIEVLFRQRMDTAIDNALKLIDPVSELTENPSDQLFALYCAAFAIARSHRDDIAGAVQSTRQAFEIIEATMQEFGK